jgi:hypothetical protein
MLSQMIEQREGFLVRYHASDRDILHYVLSLWYRNKHDMNTVHVGRDAGTLDTHGLHAWDMQQGCDRLRLAFSRDLLLDLGLLLLGKLIAPHSGTPARHKRE